MAALHSMRGPQSDGLNLQTELQTKIPAVGLAQCFVMGPPGAGKRSLLRALAGQPVDIGGSSAASSGSSRGGGGASGGARSGGGPGARLGGGGGCGGPVTAVVRMGCAPEQPDAGGSLY